MSERNMQSPPTTDEKLWHAEAELKRVNLENHNLKLALARALASLQTAAETLEALNAVLEGVTLK